MLENPDTEINQSQQTYQDHSLQNLSTTSRLLATDVNSNNSWANDAENHVSLMIYFCFKLELYLIIICFSILTIY